uniref:Uncharacterized protein n=1 Tax=Mesocestoides corti TaxID=53468 RepID=A0A5K3FTW6_MESCO
MTVYNGTGLFLTNHKPEQCVRRHPSMSTTLATPTIIYHSLHAIRTHREKRLAEASVVHYVCALLRRYNGRYHKGLRCAPRCQPPLLHLRGCPSKCSKHPTPFPVP